MDDYNANQAQTSSNSSANSDNNTGFSSDQIIDTDILDLMGSKNMTEEEKNELYQKMVETIELRVLARIDDKLSDEDVAEVKKAIEAKNKDAFSQILRNKQINVEQIYAEEALVYKFEMVELMNNKSKE